MKEFPGFEIQIKAPAKRKVYILDLNVSHCGSPTTTVEKEVYDDPVAVLTEVTVGFWLLQEDHEFFICVNLLPSTTFLMIGVLSLMPTMMFTPSSSFK